MGRPLDGVDVEQRAVVAHDLADLRDRLQRADLVVRGHDAHQRRPLRERGGNRARVNAPGSVDRQDGDLEPVPLQDSCRVEDRLVLDRGGDDVLAATAGGPRDALEGKVVRLGAAGGEHHLARSGTDEGGDRLARLVDALARAPPGGVQARGVAGVLDEVRKHRLEHLRPQRRRRRVVEVDRHCR